MPFVASGQKAVQPLTFHQKDYSELYEFTRIWEIRFDKLAPFLPPKVILPYMLPTDDSQLKLATDFINDVENERFVPIDMNQNQCTLVKEMAIDEAA